MKHTPEGDRTVSGVIGGVMLFMALVLFLFSKAGVGVPKLLQLLSALLAAGAVYVLMRYRFTVFTYYIIPKDVYRSVIYGDDVYTLPSDMLDFEVTAVCGRRKVRQCLLGLDTLYDALPYDCGREKTEKESRGMTYYYTARMFPRERLLLTFDIDGENTSVVIEPSFEMRQFLEKTAAGRKARLRDKDTI